MTKRAGARMTPDVQEGEVVSALRKLRIMLNTVATETRLYFATTCQSELVERTTTSTSLLEACWDGYCVHSLVFFELMEIDHAWPSRVNEPPNHHFLPTPS